MPQKSTAFGTDAAGATGANANPTVAAATVPPQSFPILLNMDCLRSLEMKPAQLIMDKRRTQP
jgi:hypothetical protein